MIYLKVNMMRRESTKEKKLKYADLSDSEVEELIMKRLREMKELLKEIRDILKEAGGYE